MTLFILMKALKECLEPWLAKTPFAVRWRDADLPAPEGEPMRPARVFLGSMPPTVNEALSAAPFVVIQAMEGADDDDGLDTSLVALRLCVASDDLEEGENDLQNLISLVRLRILELPGGAVADGRFRLVPHAGSSGRAPWERPDEQAYPFLQAHILTRWQTMGVHRRPSAWNMADYE